MTCNSTISNGLLHFFSLMVLHQPQFALIASSVSFVALLVTFFTAWETIDYYQGITVKQDHSTSKKYFISSSTFAGVTFVAWLAYKLLR